MRSIPPLVLGVAALLLTGVTVHAQTTGSRITAEIDPHSTVSLPGSRSPHANAQQDLGRTASDTRFTGITIHFKPSAAQKAELDALVKAQQTPGSPYYRQWLTPETYAAQFGLSDEDLAKVESWLEQQGFAIGRVARSRTSISFSGTEQQVESAFGTSIHHYEVGGETHFAPSTAISVPAALAGVVQSVRNLDDFRPKPHVRFRSAAESRIRPNFTSSQSGSDYLTPKDVATIYDINAAYNSGYTGVGQSIAVVGQSEISVSDIENFQSAAGLTVKDPTVVLVPGSGTAAISSGDEAESDLDLEYSGGIAKGATIYLVYVGGGSNSNYSVWDSLEYAVDTKIAPIVSMSYGACEPDLSSSDYSTLEAIMEQGASQGQSIIVSSGDSGSTACYADLTSNSTPTTAEKALAVNYPASSAYATALGGTEFPSADICEVTSSSSSTATCGSNASTYWETASGSDVISSAKSYIPEQVWNDDSASTASQSGAQYALSAGGGGVSIYTTRPSWQTGVTGIASGSYRLVPDISLASSPNNAGYLYCSSDSNSTDITGSCANGFRDSSNEYLTVAGGTSFAAPIFAGMLAILNQKENSTGQGLVNSTLYTMAANSTTYASAFHDITSGSNACTAGTTYCSTAGAASYSATTGYDEATGLGSLDFYNLMTSWTAGTAASLEPTTTALSAASSTPSSGAADTITITVAAQSSSIATTPTGTLTILVDGTTKSSSLALSSGTATYAFSSTTSGAHVITATYSGDSTFAPSTGTATVDVGGTSGSSSSGSFTLAATNVTAAQGSSGTSTVTVTSTNSYAGTVGFTLSTSSSSLSSYGCYLANSVAVSANGTATTTVTIYTSASACSSSAASGIGVRRSFVYAGTRSIASVEGRSASRVRKPLSAAILAAVLLCGFGRRRKLWNVLGLFLLLAAVGLFTACGSSTTTSSSSSSSSSNTVSKGTYTLTLVGEDSSSSSIAASTTFTLTVD